MSLRAPGLKCRDFPGLYHISPESSWPRLLEKKYGRLFNPVRFFAEMIEFEYVN